MRDSRAVLAVLERQRVPLRDASGLLERLEGLADRFPSVGADALGLALARRGGIEALHVEAVLFVEACLAQDPKALAELDALVATTVRALRRRANADELDELCQRLRIRLLVPVSGAAPKLALYGGRGSLAGYLRVVALNLLNRQQAERVDASAGALVAAADGRDWESQVVRVDQQAQFRQAFQRAVSALTLRQRTLLRLNLLDGLSIDELGPVYAVSRATAARWLAEARQALEQQTRREVASALKLDAHEVERLLASAQQGFQLSLDRALRESVAPPDHGA
jgi:RNA polymerase sigma-70 factor (ECF subfamily)